jgi:hypothetical protein
MAMGIDGSGNILKVFKSGQYYKNLKTRNIVLCLDCDYYKYPTQFTGIFLMSNIKIVQIWGISDFMINCWEEWNP